MKALAIDSASSCMTISAKNDDLRVTLSLDIGPTQSQELLPAIDYVLKKVKLTAGDLDYTALCKGPGTFTGLRLAFSALKAIELAFSKPVYGISTLECYANAYKRFNGLVVPTVDAKKNQFFAAVYENGKTILEPQDTQLEQLIKVLDKEKTILCVGPDALIFAEELKKADANLNVVTFGTTADYCASLFTMAEEMIAEKKEPLKDFEGPEYLRKSEAELALESKDK